MRTRGQDTDEPVRVLGELAPVQQVSESLNVRYPRRAGHPLQVIGVDGFAQLRQNRRHVAQVAGLRDMTNEIKSRRFGRRDAHGSGLRLDIHHRHFVDPCSRDKQDPPPPRAHRPGPAIRDDLKDHGL